MRNTKFSREKEDSIVKDYLEGLNTVQIANKWNTYNTSIRRVLLRRGITPKTIKERLAVPNPFKDNDEKSEYFLGLLLTDGCIHHRKNVNSVSISLSLKDEEMVESFKEFINPSAKVSKVLQKRYGTYMYSFSVRNDSIARWLEKRGNFINKSYECDIYIPLSPNILRGIFDGDGYWHSTNNGHTMLWGVCGKSRVFLEKIQKYLLENGIMPQLYKREKVGDNYLYYLEISKTVDIVRVANLMYKDAHIFLIRKYDKWHLFEETLREKFSKFKERDASPNPEPSRNKSNYLINKQNGQFIMEGAETIMRYLNL